MELNNENYAIDITKLLPSVPEEAMSYIQDVLAVNQKIKDNFFEENLILVTSLPKSASTAIARVATTIRGCELKVPQYNVVFPVNNNFRLDILFDQINGGVHHNHAHPIPENIEFVARFNLKNILVTRHPLDQLIAGLFNNIRYANRKLDYIHNGYVFDNLCPFELEHFLKSSVDENIEYMLDNGYLFNAMSWMATWIKYSCNRDRTLIVKCEDYLEKTDDVIMQIETFLDFESNEVIRKRLANLKDEYKEWRIKEIASSQENVVWTGGVGIYKAYFNNKNLTKAKQIFDSFCKIHPAGKLFSNYYEL